MSLKSLTRAVFFSLILLSAALPAHAQFAPTELPLSTSVTGYRLQDKPETMLLVLRLGLEPQWYTYGHDPGDTGKPTTIAGKTRSGESIAAIYPQGIRKKDAFSPSDTINAYLSGTRLYALVPVDSPVFPVSLTLELLLCHPSRCIPARLNLTHGDEDADITTLPFAHTQPWWNEFTELREQSEAVESTLSDLAKSEDVTQWNFTPEYLHPGLEVSSLLSAVLMGLLAGLILNIMPCVLPVVSLKLSALLNAGSGQSERERIHAFREHNAFFALGVLTFFLFLAIVLGGTGKAWGALFQHQWLVLGIAAVIFTLSLSLFGLFHLPVIDLKFGTGSTNPRTQAFFTGNLTTLLATPCSGPFLGGVLSWALVQGPLVIVTVFISIGIGMSSPYLLLILFPGLSRFLPRSGPWIEYVEKSIAFFLVATSFYLVSIALGETALRILAPLWAILLGGWLWQRTRASGPRLRWLTRLSSLALLAALVFWTTPSTSVPDPWEPFSPTDLSQRIGKERLFVDFTADWCPTCKVLEATVLTPENVHRWEKRYDVAFIKVDMTERDPEAEALLRALGSSSIPAAALFSPGDHSASPMVLRDLFTESQLENILESWEK